MESITTTFVGWIYHRLFATFTSSIFDRELNARFCNEHHDLQIVADRGISMEFYDWIRGDASRYIFMRIVTISGHDKYFVCLVQD